MHNYACVVYTIMQLHYNIYTKIAHHVLCTQSFSTSIILITCNHKIPHCTISLHCFPATQKSSNFTLYIIIYIWYNI